MLSEVKDMVFWGGLVFGVPVLALLTARFRKLRDIVFFCVVLGTTRTDWLDINFLSQEVYRGTTRGIEITYLDLLVLALMLALLLNARRDGFRFYWPAGLGALFVYLLYCTVNVVTHDPKIYGVFELAKICRGIFIFATTAFYMRSEREIHVLFRALLVAAFIEGLYGSYQRYVLHQHRIRGTFSHPNELSLYCAMLAPALLIYAMMAQRTFVRVIYLGGTALAAGAVVLSISRMGNLVLIVVIAAALVGCLRLRPVQSNYVLAGLIAVAALAGGMKAYNTLAERYSEASFSDEYGQETSGRGLYLRLARAIILEHFFGVGLNNWSYWVSANAARFNLPYEPYPEDSEITTRTAMAGVHIGGSYQAPPAHNLMAITAGELGWPGLALILMLWVQWFTMAVRLLRSLHVSWRWFGMAGLVILLAVFLQNITEYEFRVTSVFFLTLITAGSISSMLREARKRPIVVPQQRAYAPGNLSNATLS